MTSTPSNPTLTFLLVAVPNPVLLADLIPLSRPVVETCLGALFRTWQGLMSQL